VKVTLREQLAPAPRLEPHVLLRAKSVALVPIIATPPITSSELPVLVTVSTCGLLPVPTIHTPKFRLAGARLMVGGGGGADDPLPQPLSKYNPPRMSTKYFFTVPLLMAASGRPTKNQALAANSESWCSPTSTAAACYSILFAFTRSQNQLVLEVFLDPPDTQ